MNRLSLGEVKASPFSLSAALTKDFITPDTVLYHGTVGSFDKFDLKAPRNFSGDLS